MKMTENQWIDFCLSIGFGTKEQRDMRNAEREREADRKKFQSGEVCVYDYCWECSALREKYAAEYPLWESEVTRGIIAHRKLHRRMEVEYGPRGTYEQEKEKEMQQKYEGDLINFKDFCKRIILSHGIGVMIPNEYQINLFRTLYTGGSTFQTSTPAMRGQGTTTLVAAYIAWRIWYNNTSDFRVRVHFTKTENTREFIALVKDFVRQANAVRQMTSLDIAKETSMYISFNNGVEIGGNMKYFTGKFIDFCYAEAHADDHEVVVTMGTNQAYIVKIPKAVRDEPLQSDNEKTDEGTLDRPKAEVRIKRTDTGIELSFDGPLRLIIERD